MAVGTYIQNDWFIMSSEVYAEIGKMLIFPVMRLLGIDQKSE